MILNMLFRDAFPVLLQSPINCGAFAMLFSLILVPVVSWITKKPDEEKVNECFSCYDRKVVVSAKESLGDEIE